MPRKARFRYILKVFFISLNAVAALLFLLGCVAPYVRPGSWWFSGFPGLFFPYLLLVQLLFLIFWLFARPRLALIPFICMLIGWKQISVVFAWHAGSGFDKRHPAGTLRLIDWNVHNFNGPASYNENSRNIPHELSATIIKYEPDIVCMQEFNNANNADHLSHFTGTFPYYYFASDNRTDNNMYQSGCIIFSKYPIIRTGRKVYPSKESLIFADIVRANDTLRIYTTHLQSFRFKKEDYNDLAKIRDQDHQSLDASRSLYRKMKAAFNERGGQADIAREETSHSPYPSVVCGDFNDVPNSYTYFRIRGDRQDAFQRKGFGIGRSFTTIAPTLRIDYILPSREFAVQQFDLVDEDLSDHIMLVTDLVLKK